MMIKDKMRSQQANIYILLVATIIFYSIIMYQLFYMQCCNGESRNYYCSDMLTYLIIALGKDSWYQFPYPIFFYLIKGFLNWGSIEFAASLAATCFNSLSVVFLVYYINKILTDMLQLGFSNKKWLNPCINLLSVLLGFSIFFISMLYVPKGYFFPGIPHKYLGVFSPNPYHNATYMVTRPFSILTFFSFASILEDTNRKTNWKDNIFFSISLLLTTMAKPSFTLVFVITAGLIMIGRLIWTKGKNWNYLWKLGICFIPTGIDLIYQYLGVFASSTEEKGIGFGICEAWKLFCGNIPFAIIFALAFPGLFLLLNLKELKKNFMYRFSWEMVVIALCTLAFCHEKGSRFDHLNFSWGYMHAIFFVFVTSLILLIRNTIGKRQHIVWLVMEWLAYGWHLFCGIIYFVYIYQGGCYYSF